MQLTLQYKELPQGPVAAAFIRGEDPLAWLKEIGRWGLSLQQLVCYAVPVSRHTITPGGVLVVFNSGITIPVHELQEPYTCIQDNLYIPLQAAVTPVLSKREWADLLLWHCQVFHPVLGFTGFEKEDRLDWAGVVPELQPQVVDWSFAHLGSPLPARFHQINLEGGDAAEMMAAMKEDIGEKGLDAIPGKQTTWQKAKDVVKFTALWPLWKLSKLSSKFLPNIPMPASLQRSGLFQRFQNWLEQNLEELERRRRNEMQRLLDMFDENDEEALQYAIPLSSSYMNRGKAPASDKLHRRGLNFDLRKLGGGTATDVWDISEHYQSLHARYTRAAQHAIAQQDFKKAAYIYAHLLNDYFSAARALEQGGYYREAATLYKDHLKNKVQAAGCLEKGGLYSEAIVLYNELGNNEKVGDLYRKTGQDAKARSHYEIVINSRLESSDNLDASRLILEKLEDKERAKQTLLDGWNGHRQTEACLKKYFDLTLPAEDVPVNEVTAFYSPEMPQPKKAVYLQVLKHVFGRHHFREGNASIQQVAYEIVHSSVENKEMGLLSELKYFFPEDRLLEGDASRYKLVQQKTLVSRGTDEPIRLDATTTWMVAVWHRNQFLVAGIKKGFPQLARVSWYGNVEYYSWDIQAVPRTGIELYNTPYYSDKVLLRLTGDNQLISRKVLPKSKYFADSLLVHWPSWLDADTTFLINAEDEICCFSRKEATLRFHNLNGDLLKAVAVTDNPSELQHYISKGNKGFYLSKDSLFTFISLDGVSRNYDMESVIRCTGNSAGFSTFYAVVSTNAGCYLIDLSTPESKPVFFAQELIPLQISFVAGDKFVLLTKHRAFLFAIEKGIPGNTGVYNVPDDTIAVMPANNRNRFITVNRSGTMTPYSIP